ncbi:hypothetical protein GF312_20615 [Candidatus Poribacteria bacterium]|nr:hypothetical protein [Candidatus Poribacteria bacterium]
MGNIKYIGFDLSTTGLAAGGLTEDGQEVFNSIPMKGDTTWHDEPAFDLTFLPSLFIKALDSLKKQGFKFAQEGGLSLSVRQHDMVLLDSDGKLLIPALSWQCNASVNEVKELQNMGAEKVVGRIEPRLILPKLMWALKQESDLKNKVSSVMTTGDYIAWCLTGGEPRLSTSDALSNGLLEQNTKKLAKETINSAGLNSSWFPEVIQSGTVVETVKAGANDKWKDSAGILDSWKVVSGLGDNHAGAVGCGLSDLKTIVVSAGSSGTINRMIHPSAELVGEALCFEYYQHRLLLLMLADCATRYSRFVKEFGEDTTLDKLNELAQQAKPGKLLYVSDSYPNVWEKLTLGEKTASVQSSIAADLASLVQMMLAEVKGEQTPIERLVLTGGLSQSEHFRNSFRKSVSQKRDFKIYMIDRQGPMAYQAAALGATINAMVGVGIYTDLKDAARELCPLKSI